MDRSRTTLGMSRDGCHECVPRPALVESYKSLQAGLYFPGGVDAGNSRKRSHTAVCGTKQGRQIMNRMIAELSPIHD